MQINQSAHDSTSGSNVECVLPEDPASSRVVCMYGIPSETYYVSYAEFDAEEYARDWRRDIQGAVYLLHHTRATFLTRPLDDDRKGVQSEC